jgi:hypothetical protein
LEKKECAAMQKKLRDPLNIQFLMRDLAAFFGLPMETLLDRLLSGSVSEQDLKKLGRMLTAGSVEDEAVKLLESIAEGDHHEVLRERFALLLEEKEHEDVLRLAAVLKLGVSPLFYREEALEKIQSMHEGEIVEMLLLVFQNSCGLWENIPSLLSERLFQEALSMPEKDSVRYQLLQAAADNGHPMGAFLFASHLMEEMEPAEMDGAREKAAGYFRMAATHVPAALWMIAHYLELGVYQPDDFQQLLAAMPLCDRIRVEPSAGNRAGIESACRIHWHLYQHSFFRSGRALRRMMEEGKILMGHGLAEEIRGRCLRRCEPFTILDCGSGMGAERPRSRYGVKLRRQCVNISADLTFERGIYDKALQDLKDSSYLEGIVLRRVIAEVEQELKGNRYADELLRILADLRGDEV